MAAIAERVNQIDPRLQNQDYRTEIEDELNRANAAPNPGRAIRDIAQDAFDVSIAQKTDIASYKRQVNAKESGRGQMTDEKKGDMIRRLFLRMVKVASRELLGRIHPLIKALIDLLDSEKNIDNTKAAFLYNFINEFATPQGANNIDVNNLNSAQNPFLKRLEDMKESHEDSFGYLMELFKEVQRNNANNPNLQIPATFIKHLEDFEPESRPDRRQHKNPEILMTSQEESELANWANYFAHETHLDDPDPIKRQERTNIVARINMVLGWDPDQTVRDLKLTPIPGHNDQVVKNYINNLLQTLGAQPIDTILAGYQGGFNSYEELHALERKQFRSTELNIEQVKNESEHGEWRGYTEIAEIMMPYIKNEGSIYKKALKPRGDQSGVLVPNGDGFEHLRRQARQVVSILFRALQANPSEAKEMFQELREGSVLNYSVRKFYDWAREENITAYLDTLPRYRNTNDTLILTEKANLTRELSDELRDVANSFLTNRDMQEFGANIHEIMLRADGEQIAKVYENYKMSKYKDIFTHSVFANMAPQLWEAYLDRITNNNDNVVESNTFTSEVKTTDDNGVKLEPGLYRIRFKTKDGFKEFAKEYFKRLGIDDVSEGDLEEAFVYGRAYDAQTMRTPALFSRTIPRHDFEQALYQKLTAAINLEFSYGEELGGRNLVKGDWVRMVNAVWAERIAQDTGLAKLLKDPWNPKKIMELGEMWRNHFIEFVAPVELEEEVDRTKMYYNDNLIKLSEAIKMCSVGDYYSWGWRTKMFKGQYSDDRDGREFSLGDDFIQWSRARGGIIAEFISADDWGDEDAKKYLRRMAQLHPELRKRGEGQFNDLTLEMLRHGGSIPLDNELRAYIAGGALAEEQVMEITEGTDHGISDPRKITYNEFLFRMQNANRGRSWYHESLANPAQYLLNLEHIMNPIKQGRVTIKEPDQNLDPRLGPNGQQITHTISAADFYMSNLYDGPNGIALTRDDAKKRRQFRYSIKEAFAGRSSIEEITFLMKFYERVYDQFGVYTAPQQGVPRLAENINDARGLLFDNLAVAYGRARYIRHDPKIRRDGRVIISSKDIFNNSDQQLLNQLEAERTLAQNNNQSFDLKKQKELNRLYAARVLSNTNPDGLLFGNEGLIKHSIRSVVGNAVTDNDLATVFNVDTEIFNTDPGNRTQAQQAVVQDYERVIALLNQEEKPYFGNAGTTLDNRYVGDAASWYHRLGKRTSKIGGFMTAPSFDFDTTCAANHGDDSGESQFARHASNYPLMHEAQEAMGKLYRALKESSTSSDPLKLVWEAMDKIKSAFKDTVDEATGRNMNAMLLQYTIAYLLKDDRNRIPGWGGELVSLFLGDDNSISRNIQGPGSFEINRDNLYRILKHAMRDSLITQEAMDRILKHFNATLGMFWAIEGVPNIAIAFVVLAFVMAIKDSYKELTGEEGSGH